MLVENFFNLTEPDSKRVVISVGEGFGGTILTFTDDAGDELKIVLCQETIGDLFAKLMQVKAIKAALITAAETAAKGVITSSSKLNPEAA